MINSRLKYFNRLEKTKTPNSKIPVALKINISAIKTEIIVIEVAPRYKLIPCF